MTVPDHLYRPLIEKACAGTVVPPNVLEAMCIVESGMDPMAKSASNALGLTQIIYRLHKRMVDEAAASLKYQPHENTLYVPEVSLQAGARHLTWLYTSDGSQSWERAVRAYHSGSYDPPKDFVDGQGTSSDQHIAKFDAALKEVEAYRAGKEPPMAGMKAHRFDGLNADVWLPDDIIVEKKIISHPRFRSGEKSSRIAKSTWHDTGNPNTNAQAEWTWANNGRQGAGVGGYNFIFDDTRIIFCQPLDEVVWAAGTATGNATSWHAEQAWGKGVNFQRSFEVGAALHGGLIAAKGWQVDTSLVQHNIWYGKHCPGQIRNKGLWPTVVRMVSEAAYRARAASIEGNVKPPTPIYAKPIPIPELATLQKQDFRTIPPFVDAYGIRFWHVADRIEAVRATPRLQHSGTGAPKVGPDINPGEQFDVSWIYQTPNGEVFYLSPWFSRVRQTDTRRVADVIAA